MNVLAIQPKVVSHIQKIFQNNKLSHAYLFAGEAGVGKKQVAFWMAKKYFCLSSQNNEPCNECSECKRVDSLNHPDLHFIEPDGQSIKIDQIRSLQKEFHYKGVESDKKCYIIQHVDKMTTQAANSLLKFLEEPNGQSLAILLTENKQRLLDTIISRVQLYQFQPLSDDVIYSSFIKEGLDEESAFLLSRLTKSVEKGKTYLEDDWFSSAKILFFRTMGQLIEKPFEAIITMQSEWPEVFSDKEKQLSSLKLLTIWFREIVNHQLGRKIHLKRQTFLLDSFSRKLDIDSTTSILEELIDGKRRLGSNGHYVLILEHITKTFLDNLK